MKISFVFGVLTVSTIVTFSAMSLAQQGASSPFQQKPSGAKPKEATTDNSDPWDLDSSKADGVDKTGIVNLEPIQTTPIATAPITNEQQNNQLEAHPPQPWGDAGNSSTPEGWDGPKAELPPPAPAPQEAAPALANPNENPKGIATFPGDGFSIVLTFDGNSKEPAVSIERSSPISNAVNINPDAALPNVRLTNAELTKLNSLNVAQFFSRHDSENVNVTVQGQTIKLTLTPTRDNSGITFRQ